MNYLDRFHEKLVKMWKGSLVSVREVRALDRNAKKYLSQLAGERRIERVIWGWYWIPDQYGDFFDFFVKEKHFKILQKQSAASVWNGDFIHRNAYAVAVEDPSYGKALERFASSRGWQIRIDVRKSGNQYEKVSRIAVEPLEDTIVDCVKEWAFTDAFAALYQNYEAIDWNKLSRHYWERISRCNARVGQVLKYGASLIARDSGKNIYHPTRATVKDEFVRRQVAEAVEKVIELG